jgi:hypothetical protein
MSVMKRLLYVLSISILLFSCRKEYSYEGGPTSNPTYYLMATVDGVPLEFNVDNEAAYTISSSTNVLELIGFASSDLTDNTSIILDIHYDDVTPGVGTYTGQTDDYFVTGIYDFNDPDNLYTAGATSALSVQPLSITITSIADNIVEGTFSGAFYLTDGDGNVSATDYIIISNGRFRLPLQ